jgi:glycerate kinase
MKILIAPDSFKDSLSSVEVANAIERGLKTAFKGFLIKKVPVADGGEGTVDSIINATGGKFVENKVHDPLMRLIKAKWGISGNSGTAIIEMAAASGIELLKMNERNPWVTTTYGTGELIKHALDNNCRKFIIGIGGSATNDGGVGMAMALGTRFLDKNGEIIGYGGGALSEINSIDLSGLDSRAGESEFIIACDVNNPLYGPTGASHVYAKQKGAAEEMRYNLDDNLLHYANVIKKSIGKDVSGIPGSGAAGGLGAGFLAFLNSHLESGFGIVKNEVGLEEHCKWADVVITGEGKIDEQTKFGKTPKGVADVAKMFNKKVIAIGGTLGKNYTELYNCGFDAIFSIMDKPMTLDAALKDSGKLIENLGITIGNMLMV